jgi:hypothetical protein
MSQNAAIETMLKMAADDDRLAIYTYRCWNIERATEVAFVTADSPLRAFCERSGPRLGSTRPGRRSRGREA